MGGSDSVLGSSTKYYVLTSFLALPRCMPPKEWKNHSHLLKKQFNFFCLLHRSHCQYMGHSLFEAQMQNLVSSYSDRLRLLLQPNPCALVKVASSDSFLVKRLNHA
ncbi:hypothetical protein CY34DRAFT_799903 [Suillus luteus UH-Slu-Lm8-n1]|uniref:Uncharacterized protein n=1 Tax=Suillus luteus UH-Slu-Lm8-n1 TaxID=930992 RepID=A0A0D0BV87_9AGAM|nr:hypothetical protein CY34DRAFT_799903 [Suillus luteus UH-Slu-Lm8-n1]